VPTTLSPCAKAALAKARPSPELTPVIIHPLARRAWAIAETPRGMHLASSPPSTFLV
jgi:hypothetical protein